MLIDLLDSKGFRGKYNFLYLPVDFTHVVALGYALVCFETHGDAQALIDSFLGTEVSRCCEITASWSEPSHCLLENIERYRNSAVMHPSVPDEYKPILFENGVPATFPGPTQSLR